MEPGDDGREEEMSLGREKGRGNEPGDEGREEEMNLGTREGKRK